MDHHMHWDDPFYHSHFDHAEPSWAILYAAFSLKITWGCVQKYGERASRSPQNQETFCFVPLFISHYLGWYLDGISPKFVDQFPAFIEKKQINCHCRRNIRFVHRTFFSIHVMGFNLNYRLLYFFQFDENKDGFLFPEEVLEALESVNSHLLSDSHINYIYRVRSTLRFAKHVLLWKTWNLFWAPPPFWMQRRVWELSWLVGARV